MRTISASDIILTAKERNYWMYPLLWPGCLAMLYAAPGIGKSYVALWIAATLACGGRLWKFKASEQVRCLVLDGEMGIDEQFPRISELGLHISPDDEHLKFITPDICDDYRLPNLASPEGQIEIDDAIVKNKIQFVVVDNYNTIVSPLPKEDDVQTWGRFEHWLIKWRARGVSVLTVHHAGKGGAQLGTSRKEQIMNWIAKLSRPMDYEMSQGAKFMISFDKLRHGKGLDVEPLLVSYDTTQSPPWVWSTQGSNLEAQVLDMKAANMSPREIAASLNVSLFKVKKLLRADQIDVQPLTPDELEDRYF